MPCTATVSSTPIAFGSVTTAPKCQCETATPKEILGVATAVCPAAVPGNAPLAPQNLVATSLGIDSISLACDPVSQADIYRFEMSQTSGGPYQFIGASTTPDFLVGPLEPNTTYYFVAYAENPAGRSAASNEASATTDAITSPPAPPQNVTGVLIAEDAVELEWDADPDDPTVDWYRVERATVSGGPYTIVADPHPLPPFEDTALTLSTVYYYIVYAVSATEGDSTPSAEFAISTADGTQLPTPANFTATPQLSLIHISEPTRPTT